MIKRLETTCFGLDPIDPLRLLVDDVIEALRENAMREVQRLGQEIEQEPVGWVDPTTLHHLKIGLEGVHLVYETEMVNSLPLYDKPQRTWVGLTRQERDEINERVYGAVPHHVVFHHAIEARLKELNT